MESHWETRGRAKSNRSGQMAKYPPLLQHPEGWCQHQLCVEGGLYARRPALCVPLTSRHRRDRLQWARHGYWTPDQWRAVLFMTESKFSQESNSRRYLIWREPAIRYHPSNILERDAYGRGNVCVWGGISLAGRTDLYVFPRGTVNAEIYRDDILDAYVPHMPGK
ncbi:Transposable element Tcb2 transposase, partial [Stegodyphus mimosarum]